MSLLTDPSSIFSDQGTGVMGGLPGLNRKLETENARKQMWGLASTKANIWQNETRKERAEAGGAVAAGPDPMSGLISGGLGIANKIFGAGAPGSNANSGYDVGNSLWQGVGQEFGSFASGADLSGGVGSSLGSSWGDSFSADNFLGGW